MTSLKAIWTMLDDCAPGYSREEKLHHWWIRWQGKTFESLPLGDRGKADPEIQLGKVRKMCRHLGISLACAGKHISGL